jgi:cell division protein FtsI (penicillin-binding protein 3)
MNFPSKKVMPRFLWVGMVLALLGVAIVCKALYTMTIKRDYWLGGRDLLTVDSVVIEPARGSILACDGRPLAVSLSEYKITLDFKSRERNEKVRINDQLNRDTLFTQNLDTIVEVMCRVLPNQDPVKYKQYLLDAAKDSCQNLPLNPTEADYAKYKDKKTRRKIKNQEITYLQLCEIRGLPLLRSHAYMGQQQVKKRKTPHGQLAYRTVGSYKDVARFGLELTFDSVLAGEKGYKHYQKVLNKNIESIDKPAVDGSDIVTTLDIDMQDLCEQTLKNELTRLDADSGAVILMDVKTGDIKAMVSLQNKGEGYYFEYKPNAISALYEPGSVFKPISFLVAMRDKRITTKDQLTLKGGTHKFANRTMRDDHLVSGTVSVKKIISESINTGTSIMIDNAYHNDPQAFYNGIQSIGAAAHLQLPLDGYLKPYVRNPSDKNRFWSPVDLPWMSIGYATMFSPMNIVNFYAGIANDGKLMYPRLVKAIMKDGQVVKEFEPRVLNESIGTPENISYIQDALAEVVRTGTAKRHRSHLVSFAGKTGTAQIWLGGNKTPVNSITYVGYFPADNPQYACVVNMQKRVPAYGNMCTKAFRIIAERVMAKTASRSYDEAGDSIKKRAPQIQRGNMAASQVVLKQLNVKHQTTYEWDGKGHVWGQNEAEEGNPRLAKHSVVKGEVPDVRGYGLTDAVYLLRESGLKVKAKGCGTVSEQSLEKGHVIKPGETIYLTLNPSRNKKKKEETKEPPAKATVPEKKQVVPAKPDSVKKTV